MSHSRPTPSVLRAILLAAGLAALLAACAQAPEAKMSGSSAPPAQSTASPPSGAIDWGNYTSY